MISDFFEILSQGIIKLSRYLYSVSKETGDILVDLWRIIILLSDLGIQWSQDKDNARVINEMSEIIKQNADNKHFNNVLEEKFKNDMQIKETEMNVLKKQYYQLQENHQIISQKLGELLKQRDDDIGFIQNGGGVLKIIRNIKQLDDVVDHINYQSIKNKDMLKGSIQECAQSLKQYMNKDEFDQLRIVRKKVGVQNQLQPPGDIAIGHFFTEQSIIPLLALRYFFEKRTIKNQRNHQTPDQNLQTHKQQNTLENSTLNTSKGILMHKFLMLPIQKFKSPMNQFIQWQFQKGTLKLIETLQTLIDNIFEQTFNDRLISIIFNLCKTEGLDSIQFNKIKTYYQYIITNLTLGEDPFHQSFKISALDLSKDKFQEIFKEDSEFLWNESLSDFSGNHFGILLGAWIVKICEVFSKQQNKQFEDKVVKFQKMMEEINEEQEYLEPAISEYICSDVFPQYESLDYQKVWLYLIWRFITVFKNKIQPPTQLTAQVPVKFYRNSQNENDQQIFQTFMVDTLRKIKAILLFNPQVFDRSQSSTHKSDQEDTQSIKQTTDQKKRLSILENKNLFKQSNF